MTGDWILEKVAEKERKGKRKRQSCLHETWYSIIPIGKGVFSTGTYGLKHLLELLSENDEQGFQCVGCGLFFAIGKRKRC